MSLPRTRLTMYNLENCLVPKLNSDETRSKQSMDKLEAICHEHDAQLWQNRDIRQNATIVHAPT